LNRTLTTSQTARLLGVSDQTIANWIDQGKLPAGRTPGGHRRVEADDLVEFLKKQKLRVPEELARRNPMLLVVDDEPAVTGWLAQMIQANFPDCQVVVANDGYSAGEIVTAERPEVVILDLYMPGMDGFEVCRKIKSRDTTRETFVLAITARPSPQAEQAALEAGASAYLPKPIDSEELVRLLTNLVR
jgi:two-component system OmpR family response regulator